MDPQVLVGLLSAFVGGGALGAIVKAWMARQTTRQKVEVDDATSLRRDLLQETKSLREEVRRLMDELQKAQLELVGAKSEIASLRAELNYFKSLVETKTLRKGVT